MGGGIFESDKILRDKLSLVRDDAALNRIHLSISRSNGAFHVPWSSRFTGFDDAAGFLLGQFAPIQCKAKLFFDFITMMLQNPEYGKKIMGHKRQIDIGKVGYGHICTDEFLKAIDQINPLTA